MTGSNAAGEAGERFAEAAEWYLRLRGDLTTEEILEWEQWYANPKNLEALEFVRRVSPIHGRLRRPELMSAESVQADDYDGSVSVSEWVTTSMSSEGGDRRASPFSPHRAVFWALAATVAGLVLGSVFFSYGRYWGSGRQPVLMYETQAGEHRDVPLSDGSNITLGARTKMSTHYSAARRIIFLEEGEALFSVAKDKSRPFTVVAAGGSVTALGTKFNVRSDLNRVTVTVTEGVVEVAPSEISVVAPVVGNPSGSVDGAHRNAWLPARLSQGQEVTYEAAKGRSSVAAAEPGAAEWVSGRLQYRHVPLKYVAADVQRYFNKAIVMGDEAAGEYEFTGTIYQAEVSDWFQALEKIFPLDVAQSDDHVVIQSRIASAPQSHSQTPR